MPLHAMVYNGMQLYATICNGMQQIATMCRVCNDSEGCGDVHSDVLGDGRLGLDGIELNGRCHSPTS